MPSSPTAKKEPGNQASPSRPGDFLGSDDVLDATAPAVRAAAGALGAQASRAAGAQFPDSYVLAAYRFVRDEVAHSVDAANPLMTVRASEVLEHRTGLCFAQSHLLAALLRAGGVPAGLCYQRLAGPGSSHVVHGLTAAHLRGAWVRLDPRGTPAQRGTEIRLDVDQLAYEPRAELGELDYLPIFDRPHLAVLSALRGSDHALQLCRSGLPAELPGVPGRAGAPDRR